MAPRIGSYYEELRSASVRAQNSHKLGPHPNCAQKKFASRILEIYLCGFWARTELTIFFNQACNMASQLSMAILGFCPRADSNQSPPTLRVSVLDNVRGEVYLPPYPPPLAFFCAFWARTEFCNILCTFWARTELRRASKCLGPRLCTKEGVRPQDPL